MNLDSFMERWNRMGKQRQLITVLMALLKQINMVEVSVPLDELDTIGTGESILMILNGHSLVLRYSPEQTELLTIQESPAWTTNAPNPYANSASSAPTDQKLADLERAILERKKQAERVSSRIRNKGLNNLTDDQPPLT